MSVLLGRSGGRGAVAAAVCAFGLFCLLALAGCGGGKGAGEPAAFEVFFTSQTRGRLTHCGCFSGQYGGLARLRTCGPIPSAS